MSTSAASTRPTGTWSAAALRQPRLALPGLTNAALAARLEEVASLLAAQDGNPFRIRAWRHAAQLVRDHDRELAEVYRHGGLEALGDLPGIGESLARAIRDLILHGRLGILDRLRGETDPIRLLRTVPGIGHALADRLHHVLGIDTLEELEVAAHDGVLEALAGVGPKRLAAIRASLAERLGHSRLPASQAVAGRLPPLEELLDVDREYREKAEAGRLPTIAPRRMNPRGERWLPVLHTSRGERHYTALFSNTPRAHALGRTHDWVVLYVDGRGGEQQCTVVTARFGPLEGRRVVRGREAECLRRMRAVDLRRSADEPLDAFG